MPYANPQEKIEKSKIYREKNRTHILAKLKEWYLRNKDYEDKRYKNNPLLFIKQLHHGIWKRPGNHTLTVEHLYELYEQQSGRCAVTAVKMTHRRHPNFFDTNISMDRIDSNGGYDIGNVRLVCYRINIMRSNMTDTDLRSWCHAVVFGPEEETWPDVDSL